MGKGASLHARKQKRDQTSMGKGPPLSSKERKRELFDEEDRISGMPDEVLVSILSLLTMKEENVDFSEFPILSNLKQLELSVLLSDKASILGLASLIKAAPVLYRFALKLKMCESDDIREVKKAPKCPHYCLKVVEVFGFVGQINDVEFVMYLIENAIKLEKVIVDPRNADVIGKPWEYVNIHKIRATRKRAKLLQTKLSMGDKLVIL